MKMKVRDLVLISVVMTLKKMLIKMENHADKHAQEHESHEDDLLSVSDYDKHHEYHESLKDVFNKHGVPLNKDFLRDLKEWKDS